MLTFVGPYSQCLSVAGISLFRQAPGRKSAVEPVDDFSLLPLHFRHFPLVFLLGVWYNKIVVPQKPPSATP